MGLFLGSAAGAWLALWHHRRGAARGRPGPLLRGDVLGVIALAVVCYQFVHVDEFGPRLYRGGFLVFDAAVLTAIVCATRRRSLFGRVLDIRPVRWIGRRSYSIYLWHWPVCVVTRPGLDVHGPAWLINSARLVLILGLSALTYRFVEVPLRAGQFGGWLRRQRGRGLRRGELAATVAVLGTAGLLGLAAVPVTAAPVVPAPTQSAPHPAPVQQSAPTRTVPRPATPNEPHSTPRRHHRAAPPAPGHPAISAYGDSVLLGSAATLRPHTSRLTLDAVEGRQAYQVLDDISDAAKHGRLHADVLIHVGNNGIISPDQLAGTLKALRGVHRVVLMTVRVPREWQDPNNDTIRAVGAHFDNVRVVDWHHRSAGHPGWFFKDGLHVTAAGARGYTRLVMAALK
jgi:hypothetical protein